MNILFSLLLLFCLTLNAQAQRLQWQPINGQEITFLPTTNTVKALLRQSEKIFIALTNTGVVRSLDAGITWQQSNQGLPTTDTRTVTVLGNLLICGVVGSQTQQEGLFSSIDTGRTWQRISSRSFGTTLFLQGIDKFLIGNGGGEAFISNDTGKTWNVLFSDKLGVSSGFFFEDFSTVHIFRKKVL